MSLHVYVDPVCPYAYCATELVESAAEALGTDVVWEPVLLGGMFRADGRPDVPMDGMPESKRRQIDADVRRRAAWSELPFTMPDGHPVRTVDALRCLVAVDPVHRGELLHAIFRAAWQQGRNVADHGVLQELVTPYGLDVPTLCADEAVRDELRRRTAAAMERGVFGVPSYRLDDGPVQWGVDRLEDFVAAHGASWKAPHPPLLPNPDAPDHVVEVFHDPASPFAYAGIMQVADVAERHGAEVVLTPILLGGLFHAIGTPLVPLATFPKVKQAWARRDMEHAAHKAQVPFAFPADFPLNTVKALRVLLQDPATTGPIYRAAWGEGRNVGDVDVLASVLRDAGFDADALIAGTNDPVIKDKLRTNTERAAALGVCGAPTFRVGPRDSDRGPRFWGQDRLEQVAATLAGWRPPA